MSNNDRNIFGWKSVFKNYTLLDALKDCKYPSCISLTLTLMIIFSSSDIFVSLQKIILWSIGIIPNILALLLAGYAIVLTVFWSDYGKNIRKYETGRRLLNNINSSYAATILIMVITLLLNLSIDLITSFEIVAPVRISKSVNVTAIFFVITLLIFSIWLLKDIAINIFNLGQTSSIFDNEIDEAKEKENLPVRKNQKK
jgi:hypothetical protein